MRLLWRAPIWLYRLNLGWLLGKRMLLLTHTGRISGLQRQAVLEVVDHDPEQNTYVIASGFGRKSDWFRNIQAQPNVIIGVGRAGIPARAEVLSANDGGQAIVDYGRRHPRAIKNLAGLMGYQLDGTEADLYELGSQWIPLVRISPIVQDE